nr:ROK family protein [Fredinandcohnia onubensis]
MNLEKKDLAIGVDLGGTKLLVALISIEGKIIKELECKSSKHGADHISVTLINAINQLVENIDRGRLRGIGVASAGVIDSKRNEIVYANNLGLENYAIGALLKDHYDLPVRVCNDANSAAIAEWIWGAGKGKRNLIYITVSTGIGAGIISDGRLITGNQDSAGEFGHITIVHKGERCECGNRGCLERYASGTALAKLANQRLKDQCSLLQDLKTGSEVTNKEIAVAAGKGDPFSISLLREVGEYLGAGVTSLIHLFNTEAIVFGGGVMNMSDFILPTVKEYVTENSITQMSREVVICKTVLGKRAGVMGASGLFFQNEKAETSTNV